MHSSMPYTTCVAVLAYMIDMKYVITNERVNKHDLFVCNGIIMQQFVPHTVDAVNGITMTCYNVNNTDWPIYNHFVANYNRCMVY